MGMDLVIASTPWLALSYALFSFVLCPLEVLLKQKYGVLYWVVIGVDYVLRSVLAAYVVLYYYCIIII